MELTPPKDVFFIIGGWNAEVGSQETPGVTIKFDLRIQNEARAKATRVSPRERTGHSKHPLEQHKRRLYIWTSQDGQYQNQIDYIICSQRWRNSTQLAKTRLGDDCASDHELLWLMGNEYLDDFLNYTLHRKFKF